MKLLISSLICLFSMQSVNAEPGKIPYGLWRLGEKSAYSPYALVVDKAQKKLYVFQNNSSEIDLLATFDSDLGKNAGDKHSTGDHKTPEGIYFLTEKLEGSALDPVKYGERAFVTNYPNFFDKQLGKTGYGIWLHAIDDKTGLERGSKGCVVVRNETIRKLSEFISLNQTPLMIFDRVEWISDSAFKKNQDVILSTLSKWKKSWEEKNIDGYIQFYDEKFKFGRMNKRLWKQYKAELNQKYQSIKVSISMPVFFEHKNNLIVRFMQEYSSPDHSDFGEKTLYMKKNGSQYTIMAEEWVEVTDTKMRSLAATNQCCQAHN